MNQSWKTKYDDHPFFKNQKPNATSKYKVSSLKQAKEEMSKQFDFGVDQRPPTHNVYEVIEA